MIVDITGQYKQHTIVFRYDMYSKYLQAEN